MLAGGLDDLRHRAEDSCALVAFEPDSEVAPLGRAWAARHVEHRLELMERPHAVIRVQQSPKSRTDLFLIGDDGLRRHRLQRGVEAGTAGERVHGDHSQIVAGSSQFLGSRDRKVAAAELNEPAEPLGWRFSDTASHRLYPGFTILRFEIRGNGRWSAGD